MLPGCRNECQQLCGRMAKLFEECGIEYTHDELVQCRDEYRDATDQQLEQCGTQTGEDLIANLEIKSGSDNFCDALRLYGE